jgi:two-component system, NarL family, invasion response regulator UvrY
MMKILIADDHAVVREGLKQILSESSEMVVTAEASTGPEVLEEIGKDDFDLVVLDIAMPGRGGLDILKEIKNKKPRLPVLILSMYPEEQYAVRVLKAGASGYMTKESAPHELVKAIQQISKGKKYVSPSLAEKLALDLEITTGRPPHESLSDREYQVMCMIASGKTLKEIAEQLSLSIKTISTYRSRILEKMNMKSNAELTHHAIKNRLVD